MSDSEKLINGCVYKITSQVNPEMAYYGSTKNFHKRMSEHKSQYKAYLKGKYTFISLWDIFDLGAYNQEIVKEYKYITSTQLSDFETFFIQNNNCINISKSITPEMRKESNKKYRQEYYENNKEKLNENIICDICKGNYTTQHKSRHYKAKKHINATKLLEKEQEMQTEKQEDPKNKNIIKMTNNSNISNINITINNL